MEIYTFDMSFGSDLKAWRKKAGLTQQELSEAAGVSVPYISNLERDFSANTRSGKPKASEVICEKFSRVLNVSLDDVLRAAGHAVKIDNPMIQDLLDTARTNTINEPFTDDERAEFREEMEYQISKAIERILARRNKP